MIIGN